MLNADEIKYIEGWIERFMWTTDCPEAVWLRQEVARRRENGDKRCVSEIIWTMNGVRTGSIN